MSSNVHEQSQTNLTHRLTNNRFDIRKLSASTTLSNVDCGKFLNVVFLIADITLTLPDALTCIGGEIRGMVIKKGTGNHTLTITAKSGQLIDGKGSAGIYENVSLGFPFSAISTGRNWCLVAGVGADGGTNLLSGVQTQNLDMGGHIITNCARFNFIRYSFFITFDDIRKKCLILENPNLGGNCFFVGDLTIEGCLTANNPRIIASRTTAFQVVEPNISTEVSWPDLGLGSVLGVTIDSTKKTFLFYETGTYLVSWSIFWQGSSNNHTVETWIQFGLFTGYEFIFTRVGRQKILGNSDETIQACTAVVKINLLYQTLMSVVVNHSASIPLNVPRSINTGANTMQISIHKLF